MINYALYLQFGWHTHFILCKNVRILFSTLSIAAQVVLNYRPPKTWGDFGKFLFSVFEKSANYVKLLNFKKRREFAGPIHGLAGYQLQSENTDVIIFFLTLI